MGNIIAQTPIKKAAISVVVTRADGTVEDHGVVSYQDNRWWKNLEFRLKKALGMTYKKDW